MTLLYNIGRLLESENNFERAIIFYNRILAQHPAYIDAILRLAVIQIEKGDFIEADTFLDKAFVIDPKNIEGFLLLGVVSLKKKDYKAAKKAFEKVLQDFDSHDVFALCALGNLNVYFARNDPKQVIIINIEGHVLQARF